MDDIHVFTKQVKGMYERIEYLYGCIAQSPTPQPDLLPPALKELGVAAEELQVATEELNQQSEQMGMLLQVAAGKYQHYQDLFNYASDAWLTTDSFGKIQEANLATTRLLKVTQNSLQGSLLIHFVPVHNRPLFRKHLNDLAQPRQSRQSFPISFHLRTGELLSLIVTVSVIPGKDGEATKLHWSLREVTELYEAIAAQQSDSALLPTDPFVEINNRPSYSFDKDDVIPLDAQTLWQINKGVVKISTLTEHNEETLLGLLKSPMTFSVGASLLPTYQATALSEVLLVKFSMSEVKASPDLSQRFLPHFHQRMQQMEVLLAIAGQRQVRDRLHSLLRFLKQEVGQPVPGGTRIDVRLTHEDLASACCTTRVTITRLLGELQRKQKITIDPQFHIIVNELA